MGCGEVRKAAAPLLVTPNLHGQRQQRGDPHQHVALLGLQAVPALTGGPRDDPVHILGWARDSEPPELGLELSDRLHRQPVLDRPPDLFPS